MKSDPDNRDLVEAFEALRNEDARLAPLFELPDSGRRQSNWRAGPGLYAACVAGAAAVVLSFFFIVAGPGSKTPPGESIAFDQFSEVISREIFAASVTEWESPTGFLLNPQP